MFTSQGPINKPKHITCNPMKYVYMHKRNKFTQVYLDLLVKCCSFAQFCTAALEHSAPAVREVAARIILSMYRQHGVAVLSYLPPKDAAARKNFLYKTLFDDFAKIDGKVIEAQARCFLFYPLQKKISVLQSSSSLTKARTSCLSILCIFQ